MLDWIDRHEPSVAAQLVTALWSYDGDASAAHLGAAQISLITPTSGTRISCAMIGSQYRVRTDFGVDGSTSRYQGILAADRSIRWEIGPAGREDHLLPGDLTEVLADAKEQG